MSKAPHHHPTEYQLNLAKNLAILNLTDEEIAKVLEINVVTLHRHYRTKLKEGRHDVKAFVVSKLMQLIKEGNPAAIMFYLKTQCRWRETDRLEVTGADGQPIEYKKVGTPKFKELTVTEWQEQFQPNQPHLN
jgi:hypothetical protein